MNFRKLIIGLFTGIISLASLSLSFSLAWYASSARLYIDTIDITFRGERNLRVSTSDDLDTFKSDLTHDELNHVDLFTPASTMFADKWMNKENPVPEFYEYRTAFFNNAGVPDSPAELDNGYFQQELYLLCDDDVYVSLDVFDNATYIIANETVNEYAVDKQIKNFKEFTREEMLEALNSLENALRFSIYDVSEKKYYIIDPNKEGITYYGGILDNNYDQYFDTYVHDDIFYEGIYGEIENRDKAIYEDVGEDDIDIGSDEIYTCFTAKHKARAKKFLLDESIANGLKIKEEPSLTLNELESYDPEVNPLVMTLERNVPKKFIFSIYLEGWDKECINTNMGASFLSQIKFKILREI